MCGGNGWMLSMRTDEGAARFVYERQASWSRRFRRQGSPLVSSVVTGLIVVGLILWVFMLP